MPIGTPVTIDISLNLLCMQGIYMQTLAELHISAHCGTTIYNTIITDTQVCSVYLKMLYTLRINKILSDNFGWWINCSRVTFNPNHIAHP